MIYSKDNIFKYMESMGFLSKDASKKLIGLKNNWSSEKKEEWKRCVDFVQESTSFVDESYSFGYRRTLIEQRITIENYYCCVDGCSNPRKKIAGGILGFNRFSETCHLRDEKHKQTQGQYKTKKREVSCLVKYNVTHESKLQTIKDKKKVTFHKNYGYDNIFSTPIFKKFIIKFWQERGVDNPSQLPQVKDKKKVTTFLNFGVCHPMQHPAIFHKAQCNMGRTYHFAFKEFHWLLQGYEKYFLKDMLIIYQPTDIYNRGIVYSYMYDKTKRKYYPDFHIDNVVYEVKSIFTYFQDFYKNIAKSKAVKQTGLNHITYTYDPKGEIIGIH